MTKLSIVDSRKFKLAIAVALLLALVVLPPSAGAQTLTLTSDPACVSRAVDKVDCFARGADNAMWHTSWSGGVQTVWGSLGGVFTSGPSATVCCAGTVAWANGHWDIDVFGRGGDNALYHKRSHDGGAWSDWERLGASGLTSAPGCAALALGGSLERIDCFARGADNAMYHKIGLFGEPPNSGWSDWESFGGVNFQSGPSAKASGTDLNGAQVCAEGSDNALYCKTYFQGWGSWESRGGALSSGPACVYSHLAFYLGYIDCFVRGTDNAIWHMVQESSNNGQVSEYSLGGIWNSGPAAVSSDEKSYDIFAVKTDGSLYHDHWNGAAWGGWVSVSMTVGQVLTVTHIGLPTLTASTTSSTGSSSSQATASDWAMLSVALVPSNAQAGVSVSFTATMALLSSSVSLPQTVNVQCLLDGQSCGAGKVTYPGPVGQPLTVHTNTPWIATAGVHTLAWSIDSFNDPNPRNNAMSISFTVQSSSASQSTSSTTTQPFTSQSSIEQVTILQTQTVTQPPSSITSQATSSLGILDLLQQNSLPVVGALGLLVIGLAIATMRRGKHGSSAAPNR